MQVNINSIAAPSTAQELREFYEAGQARLKTIEAERKEIIEQSTAQRLENLFVEERALRGDLLEVKHKQNSLRAAAARPARLREIPGLIAASIHEEQNLLRKYKLSFSLQGSAAAFFILPKKFIRPDATAHFLAEKERAEAELNALQRKWNKAHLNPAGRIIAEMRELESTLAAWKKTKPLCELGEKVCAVREARKAWEEERRQLEEKHRASAPAA